MASTVASKSGTSIRWPRPSRCRAMSAMTMATAAASAPKLDEIGKAVKRASPGGP